MTIEEQIQRLKTNIANAYTSLSNKGATLPTDQVSANLASTIDTITTGGGSEDVPSGYTTVSYVQKTNNNTTPYIDLFFIPTSNTKIETTLAITGYPVTSATVLFGSDKFRLTMSSTGATVPRNVVAYFGDNYVSYDNTFSLNTKYKITMSLADGLIINDTKVGDFISGTFTSSNTFYLFGQNGFDSSRYMFGKVYSTKIYEGDELIYDLVPVQQNDSTYYGFYNKVNGCFYAPQLPSAFTGGTELEDGAGGEGDYGDDWWDEW